MQIFGVLLSLFFIIAGVIGLIRPKVLMNPLMIFIKIIKLR